MKRLATASALLAASVSPLALAQPPYPARRVTVIAPVPAQASASAAARIVSEKMAQILGQPFTVMNMPGALGLLGARELMKAAPDGYVICFCNNGAVNYVPAAVMAKGETPPYRPSDFTPIGKAVEIYYVLVARKGLPSDFRGIVEYIRAHPGKVRIASASPMGSIVTGLIAEMVGRDKIIDVPYKGAAGESEAFVHLLGGHLDLIPSTSLNALPQIKEGNVQAIGVVGHERSPFIPGLATLEEQAPEFKEFNLRSGELTPWNGFVAPKGTPPEVVARLSSALKQALADPDVVRALAAGGLRAHFGTPDDMQKLFDRVTVDADVIKHAGVNLAP